MRKTNPSDLPLTLLLPRWPGNASALRPRAGRARPRSLEDHLLPTNGGIPIRRLHVISRSPLIPILSVGGQETTAAEAGDPKDGSAVSGDKQTHLKKCKNSPPNGKRRRIEDEAFLQSERPGRIGRKDWTQPGRQVDLTRLSLSRSELGLFVVHQQPEQQHQPRQPVGDSRQTN